MDFNGLDLMRSVKEYSVQKNLKISDVTKVLEDVIRDAEIQKYKYSKIDVRILSNGKIDIKRKMKVSGENIGGFDDEGYQLISVEDAVSISPGVTAGSFVEEKMPDLSLLRFETNYAKKALFKALNDLVRQKQYDDFVHRIGEIATFSILRIENGNLILVVNNAETILYRNKLLKGEIYRTGEYVKVYIEDVVRADRGPQIIVSRTHKNFVAQLFKQEIPEIYEGIVEIKDVARYAGSRSKISVYTSDNSIDAVGSCIGIRGVRITPIMQELRGEKIDVISYSTDIKKYVVSALGEKSIEKVVLNEKKNLLEVIVPEDRISAVIGRQGQNINLASVLTGWKINVLSNAEESKRRMDEFDQQTNFLMEVLDIEKMMAQLLNLEGYTSLTLLKNASIADLASLEGFDEDIAEELLFRAQEYLKTHSVSDEGVIEDGEKVDEMVNLDKMDDLDDSIINILEKNNILTVNRLAELDVDELQDIFKDKLNTDEVGKLIIDARVLLGWI